MVENGKRGGKRGGRGEKNDGNNTQQPNYSPSTRHLGKTSAMATLNTQGGEWRHGKSKVSG